MKKKALILFPIAILLAIMTACNAPSGTGVNSAGPEAPAEPSQESPQVAEPAPEDTSYQAYVDEYIRIVQELSAQEEGMLFSLTDIDGDNNPELAADKQGYRLSVYTCKNGKAVPVFEDWPYGAAGNAGYEYLPRENVIRSINNDFAGSIVYLSYYRINNAGQAESIYAEDLAIWHFDDKNNNGTPDADEAYSEEPVFYTYGTQKLTESEYKAYEIPGDFIYISGNRSAEEMLKLLDGQKNIRSFDFCHTYVFDSQKTNDNLPAGQDIYSVFGSGLRQFGAQMEIQKDHTAYFSIGVGACGNAVLTEENGQYFLVMEDTGKDGDTTGKFELFPLEIDGTSYVTFEINGVIVYWKPADGASAEAADFS